MAHAVRRRLTDKPHQQEYRKASETQNPPQSSEEEQDKGFTVLRDKLLKEHGEKKGQEQKLGFTDLRDKLLKEHDRNKEQDQKKEQEHKLDFTERRDKLIEEHAEKKEQERELGGHEGHDHKRKW